MPGDAVGVDPYVAGCGRGDTWTVVGDDGLSLVGPARRAGKAYFRATLKPAASPSGTALLLEYFYRDRFHGNLLRAEPTGNPKDAACVIVQSVTGRKRR